MRPMRPGVVFPRLDDYLGPLPAGWDWQLKLDDERGWLVNGVLYNRHGALLPAAKAKHYCLDALTRHPTVDLALMGFRTGGPRFIVVLDVPSGLPWSERQTQLDFPLWTPGTEPTAQCCRLATYTDARALFLESLNRPHVEGIVGRRLTAGYQFGTSKSMAKCRWT